MKKTAPPWSVPVAVDDIPETGLHLKLEAPESLRGAIAQVAGVRAVPKFTAVFDLTRRGAGVKVEGRVSGRVGQTCVVSLEPMESDVEETVDLRFVPRTAHERAAVDESAYAADAGEDAPEPLVGGKIDLGAIATEYLVLGIDPYPRKPGVEFTPPKVEDAGENPFAALAALKKGPSGGKP